VPFQLIFKPETEKKRESTTGQCLSDAPQLSPTSKNNPSTQRLAQIHVHPQGTTLMDPPWRAGRLRGMRLGIRGRQTPARPSAGKDAGVETAFRPDISFF